MIYNYLDCLTIEDCLKYAAMGFEFVIENGHVQAMVLKKQEAPEESRRRCLQGIRPSPQRGR